MLTPEEFDEVYAIERYLIARNWYRAPESGPGMWQKYDPWGSFIMPLCQAYEHELSIDKVN